MLIEAVSARRGGGFFAWTNENGIRSILLDEVFDAFLSRGEFRLVVGTDSITDLRALEMLQELSSRRPGLEVSAFLSPTSSLFHPKISWFEHEDHVSVIVGSGNLTMGGLRSNWEAFTVLRFNGDEAEEVLGEIDDYLAEAGRFFRPLHDPDVRARAAANTGNERSLRRTLDQPSPPVSEPGTATEALIAEIPRSGDRWNQVNFDLESYTEFFGAEVGTQRRISLYLVGADGLIGRLENRPSVQVKSSNFRFELEGARGVPYPVSGRPIGVFIKLASGEFIYQLLLPGNDGYEAIHSLLPESGGRTVRRVRSTMDSIRRAWPDSPLISASVPRI